MTHESTSDDVVYQFSFMRVCNPPPPLFFKGLTLTSDLSKETLKMKDGGDSRGDTKIKTFCSSSTVCLKAASLSWTQNWSNRAVLTKTTTSRLFFPFFSFVSFYLSIYQAHCPVLWCGDPVQCPELKWAKLYVENPRVSLTHGVSIRAFWWMTLIFLSSWDYFYVYLDIYLMVFHLSSTDQTGQEETEVSARRRESMKDRGKRGRAISK